MWSSVPPFAALMMWSQSVASVGAAVAVLGPGAAVSVSFEDGAASSFPVGR